MRLGRRRPNVTAQRTHHNCGCDDGAENAENAACTLGCELARCGDALIQTGVELCDDGDDNRDDGPCMPLCAPPTCGDGILQPSEACDDGDDNRAQAGGLGGCSLQCVPLARCGDGVVHPDFEECDDEVVSGDEECDDGLANGEAAACTDECKLAVCGGHPSRPQLRPTPPRRFIELVEDNAIEGYIRETYGAMLAHLQARRAADPQRRHAFAHVAIDETRHAALSWAIHRWAERQLQTREYRRLARRRRAAAERLTRAFDPRVHRAAGPPTPDEARALFDRLHSGLVGGLG